MIKIINVLTFMLLTTFMHAQTDSTAVEVKGNLELTVNIPNATSDTGKMMYALYEKNNFMAQPTQNSVEEIKDKKSSTVFKGLVAGDYAVIIFHDSNDNGKMDFNENQMPAEDFAVSNNPASFGPPQFEEARFTLSESMTIEIKL